MVLTRAQNQPGPDGIIGTADDIQDANNTDTPWVDQSQTYTSHPSHQVFLREYAMQRPPADPVCAPASLLGGLGGRAARPTTTRPTARTASRRGRPSRSRPPTCSASSSSTRDVTNIPMIAADPYGNFIPGPARGLPQYVTTTGGLVEGNLADPVPVPAERRALRHAVPDGHRAQRRSEPADTDNNPGTPPVAPTPDADDDPVGRLRAASRPAPTTTRC